jgi:hypothetical protein
MHVATDVRCEWIVTFMASTYQPELAHLCGFTHRKQLHTTYTEMVGIALASSVRNSGRSDRGCMGSLKVVSPQSTFKFILLNLFI